MSKSYREHDLNIRHSFSRTFLILANFCIDTYLILTSFQQVKLLKTKFFKNISCGWKFFEVSLLIAFHTE